MGPGNLLPCRHRQVGAVQHQPAGRQGNPAMPDLCIVLYLSRCGELPESMRCWFTDSCKRQEAASPALWLHLAAAVSGMCCWCSPRLSLRRRPSGADLSVVQELLDLIEDEHIAAPAPIEQRWSAARWGQQLRTPQLLAIVHSSQQHL